MSFNSPFPSSEFQMLKCVNHLSGDPNCLEYLQRADAIKHLIPNLQVHDGPFDSQIHIEVSSQTLQRNIFGLLTI